MSTYCWPCSVSVLRNILPFLLSKANTIFLSSDGEVRVDCVRERARESSICSPLMLHLTVSTCSELQHNHPPTLTSFHPTVSSLLVFVERSRGLPTQMTGGARQSRCSAILARLLITHSPRQQHGHRAGTILPPYRHDNTSNRHGGARSVDSGLWW